MYNDRLEKALPLIVDQFLRHFPRRCDNAPTNGRQLGTFRLVNLPISDRGLLKLGEMDRLRPLRVSGVSISQGAVDQLKRQLPKCVIIVESREADDN